MGDSPLQSVITWVSVSERMPESGKRVLCCSSKHRHVLWFASERNGVWRYGWDCATHWAELPEPPAGEEGEG